MSDAPEKVALERLTAAPEGGDAVALANAVRALRDATAPLPADALAAFLAGPTIDALRGSAARAIALDRADLASEILDLGGAQAEQAKIVVDAMVAGDAELCAVWITDTWVSTEDPEHRGALAFQRTVLGRVMPALVGGDRDHCLLALGAARSLDENPPGLFGDRIATAEATARICAGRAEHPHAAIFEACLGALGEHVFETTTLREEAARSAKRGLDRDVPHHGLLTSWAIEELLAGREDQVLQLVESLARARSERFPAKREMAYGLFSRSFGRELDRARELVRRLRGEDDKPTRSLTATARFDRAELGAFELRTSTLLLSDPCHRGVDSALQVHVRNAAPGAWVASLYRTTGKYPIVAFLMAHHEDHPTSLEANVWREEHTNDDVGRVTTRPEVINDSGQVGILDADLDRGVGEAFEAWYETCRERTLSDTRGGVVRGGCVSSSGHGDGEYPCFVARVQGRAVAVAIDFKIGREAFHVEEDAEPEAIAPTPYVPPRADTTPRLAAVALLRDARIAADDCMSGYPESVFDEGWPRGVARCMAGPICARCWEASANVRCEAGVAYAEAIAAALAEAPDSPALDDLLDARPPPSPGMLAVRDGIVVETSAGLVLRSTSEWDGKTYVDDVPINGPLAIGVSVGSSRAAGERVTTGDIDPKAFLRIFGQSETIPWLAARLVAAAPGLRRLGALVLARILIVPALEVVDTGDTTFVLGELVLARDFEQQNEALMADGRRPATGSLCLCPTRTLVALA